MKYLSVIFLLISTVSLSQVNLPELSPEAHLIEQVGYTKFQVRYGRPAARERKIMGDLVPYKRLWRTGAGKCTFISFDQPVVINNKRIPAGAYALLTIPDEKEWTVLLNSDTSKIYGEPYEYEKENEVISFTVKPARTDHYYNSFTMYMDIARYDATLYLAWEQTEISFPIKTESYEKAVSAILKSVQTSPNDPETLSRAAWFYYMNNADPQQMLAWVDQALLAGDDRWILHQRVDILERMKNYAEAKKAAERAIVFLKTTKPDSWQDGVNGYEERMKRWPIN